MLRSDLCDYSDAYIIIKEEITVTETNNDAYDKKLAFKNNAPFIFWISKINKTLTLQCRRFTLIQQKLFKNNRKCLELL